jgi:hypothetical protein
MKLTPRPTGGIRPEPRAMNSALFRADVGLVAPAAAGRAAAQEGAR